MCLVVNIRWQCACFIELQNSKTPHFVGSGNKCITLHLCYRFLLSNNRTSFSSSLGIKCRWDMDLQGDTTLCTFCLRGASCKFTWYLLPSFNKWDFDVKVLVWQQSTEHPLVDWPGVLIDWWCITLWMKYLISVTHCQCAICHTIVRHLTHLKHFTLSSSQREGTIRPKKVLCQKRKLVVFSKTLLL